MTALTHLRGDEGQSKAVAMRQGPKRVDLRVTKKIQSSGLGHQFDMGKMEEPKVSMRAGDTKALAMAAAMGIEEG